MPLQVPLSAEPILIAGVLAGSGGVIIWFAKTVIDIRDTVTRVANSLYDDQTGLVEVVYRNYRELSGAVGALTNQVSQLDKDVTRVADRCAMIQEAKLEK